MNNDLMQVLNESRIIFIDDVIDAKMANYVVTKLMYFDALGNEDITIYINSPGGSVATHPLYDPPGLWRNAGNGK